MKRLAAIMLCLPLFGVAQIEDDFSDGNFTTNPTWSGDTALFDVDVNLRLWLNAPSTSDEAHLSVPSEAIDTAEWRFLVVLDFNPSSSNKARVYLTSDQANLESSLDGYFVQIGDTEDEISLYRQDGTSSTKIIDGVDDLVDENPVEAVVLVKRSSIGLWELEVDTSLSGTFESQGTVIDTTYLTSNYFGVFCDYTSTRSDKFFFDDILASGAAYGDTIAPNVVNLEVLSSDSLLVEFSEEVDSVSASQSANYIVDQIIGNPDSVVWTVSDPDKVSLAFSSSFPIGQSNLLSISGVEDPSGNVMTTENLPFTFIEYATPGTGRLVINELLPDPTPVVDLPDAEFIEVYNKDSVYYKLDSLKIADASDTVLASGEFTISPYGYVILCHNSDTLSYAAFGTTFGLSTFPALNNSEDDLKILNGNTLLDRVTYTDDWYNDPEKASGGFSLELINPDNPCTGKANWIASISSTGGTPGIENSVFDPSPDTQIPDLLEFKVVDALHLNFVFSESIDSVSTVNSIVASSGREIDSISIIDANLFARFLTPLLPGDSDTLFLSELSDCAGNRINDTTLVFGIGALPESFDLIINELYPIPDESSPLPNAEFIELVNRTDKLITTEGLKVRDKTSTTKLESTLIQPNEILIICDDDDRTFFEDLGKIVTVTSMPSLNNAGDNIQIVYENSVIDEVNYSETWFGTKHADGFSLERINPEDLCGTSQNWSISTSSFQGTPGDTNSIAFFGPSPSLELLNTKITSSHELLIQFSGRLDTALGYSATISDKSFEFNASTFQSILTLDHEVDFERGEVIKIDIPIVQNCVNKTFTNLTTSIYLHDINDILINEVLFNPRDKGTDFVELYNQSTFDIDLQGWQLAYFDSDDSLRFRRISDTSILLAQNSYLALNEANQNLLSNYPFSLEESLLEADLPSYPNDEGSVIVYDQLGEEMDRFDYSESYHFELIDDPDGVSLERIRVDLPTNDPDNWHSASSTDNYATPGYINSQFYQNETDQPRVSLSSEMISPDNDGFQDVVSIDYVFSKPGFSLSAAVYTDKGVLVKRVASNKLIGQSGSFIWDGTNEDGEKAQTGIHVVIVEAFNLDNEKERFRLPLVVATRL